MTYKELRDKVAFVLKTMYGDQKGIQFFLTDGRTYHQFAADAVMREIRDAAANAQITLQEGNDEQVPHGQASPSDAEAKG